MPRSSEPCEFEGCESPRLGWGKLCAGHAAQLRRGTLLRPIRRVGDARRSRLVDPEKRVAYVDWLSVLVGPETREARRAGAA